MFPVVTFLKCVATEVVWFSMVAFTTMISQGSVVTQSRCGGIFSDNVITNILLILTVKGFSQESLANTR